jgi:hypothetical protein
MSMARLLVNLVGYAFLTGCTATMHGSGQGDMRKIVTPDAPPVAYQKALKAVLREGGTVTLATEPKVISARFQNTMTVTVMITPTGDGGSKVEAFTKLDAGKIAFGGVTVGDQILARYQQETL